MGKAKVFVTRLIPEAGLGRIRTACDARIWEERFPPDRKVLFEQVRGVDGILSLLNDRMDAAVMDAAGSGLKIISNYAVGFDNIDVPAATARGILVGHTPGAVTEATADLAFALLMAAARRIVEGVDYIRAGKWETFEPLVLLGRDIHGAALGIVGMGRIGQAMARRARGFDMEVLYYHPRGETAAGEAAGAKFCATLDELLRKSDFVSLHVPLNAETRHLIDGAALRNMKETAVLVNTARGGVVDPEALYEALRNGVIAAAALDVTDPEPLPEDHPLLGLPNCLVVPHIGSASVATRERMAVMAADNLIAALRGEVPKHLVNPEALSRRG
ncbi:MAG: D-glycerate dehydrogenase [Syntrophales bacterium]|nr:D-glycerate dehydrogenase [Syntrophales bacterium]